MKFLIVSLMLVVSTVGIQAQAVANAQLQTGPSKSGVVTLNINNASLETVIAEVIRQSSVKLTYVTDDLPLYKRVSLSVNNASPLETLRIAFQGTGVRIFISNDGQITLAKGIIGQSKQMQGTITGKIVDAKSEKGLSGVNVSLVNSNHNVISGEDGSYRIVGIPTGTHTVVVRLVGYSKQTRSVNIGEGATVTVDFKLEPSTSVLDQVIVTGTIVSTELKAVPNAVTVITAKQIEERGVTRIDQLFRGDIPGLFAQSNSSGTLSDQVTMFARGGSVLPAALNGTPTNPIKTYIDGIEMSDSQYLSQIDPSSIERIEILTGPQASTIYGSNAINGVMQIFTKRGSTHTPRFNGSLLSGFIQNNFSSALTPRHDYTGQISGVEAKISYNAGGSWNYTGTWTPARQTQRTNGYSGIRLQSELFSVDGSMRRSITKNWQKGSSAEGLTNGQETGIYAPSMSQGLAATTVYTVDGQTLGLTLNYNPHSWWSSETSFGSDFIDYQQARTAPGYLFGPGDSLLLLSQTRTGRTSLKYSSTIRFPLLSSGQVVLTAGTDNWKLLTTQTDVSPAALTGNLTVSPAINRQPSHNSGAFFQGQIGFKDALFLTYGLRAEWNPNYGEQALPNVAPRYGLSYVAGVGAITAKLRGSYGRSTRPPTSLQKIAVLAEANKNVSQIIIDEYGTFDFQMANVDLGPEFQQGGEGGIELYFGNRGSIIITRYNQTVDGLISTVNIADSVRSLRINPSVSRSTDVAGYGYWYQRQNINVGSIRNQGWELQGGVNVSPFSARGTYSWTKSRFIGITPKYRSQFTSSLQIQPGASLLYLPEHTGSFNITYSKSPTTVSVTSTWIGPLYRNFDELSSATSLRHNTLKPRNSTPVNYRSVSTRYTTMDLNALHRISRNFEGVLQIDNLADIYHNDSDSRSANLGRQTKAGFRIKL